MGRQARIVLGRRSHVAAAAAGFAYTLAASFSRPFTLAADVMTAVPLAAAVALAVSSFGRRKTETHMAAGGATGAARWSRWWLVWVATVGAVAAWELYCYANLPRAAPDVERPRRPPRLLPNRQDRGVRVMARSRVVSGRPMIGRHTTFAVWALLGAALGACQIAAAMSHRRLPGLGTLVQRVTTSVTGRIVFLLAWMWLGWHAFAR